MMFRIRSPMLSAMIMAMAGLGISAAHPVLADPYDGAQGYADAPATDAALTAPAPPPALPDYEQPPIPGPGYIWTPGYWAYGPAGYYWIPGAWVVAPEVGYLWTPGYWGFWGGVYLFHAGYWGPHVGFYGGIDYGCGYTGFGYEGGYWDHGIFNYNRAVNNIRNVDIHNTYVHNVTNNRLVNRVSYNGGAGGINARPTEAERAFARDRHLGETPAQQQRFAAARHDHAGAARQGVEESRVAEQHRVAEPHPAVGQRSAADERRDGETRASGEDQRTEALNRTQVLRGGLGRREGVTARPAAERSIDREVPAAGERLAQQRVTQERVAQQGVAEARAVQQRANARQIEARRPAPQRMAMNRAAAERAQAERRAAPVHQQVAQRPAEHEESRGGGVRPRM